MGTFSSNDRNSYHFPERLLPDVPAWGDPTQGTTTLGNGLEASAMV